jgi:isopentenyl-diphosphate delta-isomerase
MSKHEIIDVLNEDGEIIDTISREQAEKDNHITENVLVFVFNSLGRVWVQLRPQTKNHYPGKWDISACGGVLSNETKDEAAHRETLEEMGIEVELHHVESFLNVFPGDNGEERRRLSHVYIGVTDVEPQINDEVDEFKLWEPSELREDVVANESKYIPSFIVELDIAVSAFKERVNK